MDSLSGTQLELQTVDTPQRCDAVRILLREYAASLNVDLCFQGFDAELAGLPGAYRPPRGLLLLACVDGQPAGCGGFRPLPEADEPDACEMKRLYVRPAFRRFGLGRSLALALIDRACEAGYRAMLLDTLSDMAAARELYGSLGFIETAPYYFNPVPGAHYFRLDLDHAVTRW